jgi:RimJ/RimL family protein N-acetyltransferase
MRAGVDPVGLPISRPRLVLRPFRDADLGALITYRNDPAVARYQDWEGISRDDALALVRAHTQTSLGVPGRWQQIAIALAPGGELVGDVGLFLRPDGRSAELGFTLAGPYQGRGLAREALGGLIDALFERAELERLEAVTDTRNGPAMALLARLGFTVASTADANFKGGVCREHTFVLTRCVATRSFPR